MKYIKFGTEDKDMKVNLIFNSHFLYLVISTIEYILYYEPTIACSPVGLIRV